MIPVLVDDAEVPARVSPRLAGLREREPTRLRTSVADHERDLVALESRIWREWLSATEPSLVVMRVDGQPVSAAEFVDALDRSHDGAIRTLGLAASGVVALTAEGAREQAPALAIVLADGEPPSESARERLRAALATKRWGRIVIVGAGTIPGWVAGKGFDAVLLPALGWLRDLVGSTDVAVETVSAASTAPAAIAEALGGVLEGIGGVATEATSWFSPLLGWKGALAVTTVVGTTVGAVAVATTDDGERAAVAVSTFDAGDEGWTVWGDAQSGSVDPTYRSDVGAPAGSIEADDDVTGFTWFWRAPEAFRSSRLDPTPDPVLTFDIRQVGEARFYDACNIIVVDGDRAACMFGDAPAAEFTTTTVRFDTEDEMWFDLAVEDGLPASDRDRGDPLDQAALDSIVGSIDELFIRGEFRFQFDTGGLDNVSLGSATS